MKSEVPISDLLKWRLSQAEANAPRPPPSESLLAAARPWWETRPEQFRRLATRLDAMASASDGLSVPVLLVETDLEIETYARVLHFGIREDRLAFRFRLDSRAARRSELLEVILLTEASCLPLLCALATVCGEEEYSVEASLPLEFAQIWAALKATERMPFRLLLRAGNEVS